jgi:hypothetical protein
VSAGRVIDFTETPVASAISWSGFNLLGDEKSIAEVKRLMHRDERCAWFEDAYAKLTKIVTARRAPEGCDAAQWLARSQALLTNLRYWISHGLSEISVKEIDNYWRKWREAANREVPREEIDRGEAPGNQAEG